MQVGDTMIFATDGFTEANNDQDEEFGEERLKRYLSGDRRKPLSELVTGLVDTVESYSGQIEQSDDQTALAFRLR